MAHIRYFFVRGQRAAFTLIELLVVIGIMAVLAAGLGVTIRSFDGRAKMQSSQGLLLAALNSARAKAAVQQTTVCLLLNADKDDVEKYLREIIPVTKNGTDWTVVGDSIILPNGVYVIPPDLGAVFPAKYDSSTLASDWSKIKSFATSSSTSSATIYAPSGGASLRTLEAFQIVKFDSLGRFNAQTTIANQRTVLAVTTGEPKPGSGVTFRDHEQARGVWFSRYGVVVPINEKAGFDYNATDYDSR